MDQQNSNLKDTLKGDGYSQEEKYFHDINQKLIEDRKKKAGSRLSDQTRDIPTETDSSQSRP